MRPEHEQRFRRIVSDFLERPAGDYGELLRRGYVSSPDGVDPEEWRAEIRAQARRDKIRVVTFRDGDRATAARNRTAAEQEMRDELQRMQALRELAAAARALGHEPGRGCAATWRASVSARAATLASTLVSGDSPASDGEAIAERARRRRAHRSPADLPTLNAPEHGARF